MGFPLRPVIADLVMLHMETSVIESHSFQVPLYLRYLEDTLLFFQKTKKITFNNFTAFYGRIKFTKEHNN